MDSVARLLDAPPPTSSLRGSKEENAYYEALVEAFLREVREISSRVPTDEELAVSRRYLDALESVTRRDHLRSQDENLASVPTAFSEALKSLEEAEKFVFAAAGGNPDEVSAMLGRDWNLVHAHDRDGHTALHAAAALDHATVVRLLLERGASASVQDFEGNSPLHLAVDAGSLAAARVLVTVAGADPTLKNNAEQSPLDIVDSLPERNKIPMLAILDEAAEKKEEEHRRKMAAMSSRK